MNFLEDCFNTDELLGDLTSIGVEYFSQVNWRKFARSFGAGLLGDDYSPSKVEEKYLLVIGQWLRARLQSVRKDRAIYKTQLPQINRVRRMHTIRALRALDPKDFEYWTAGYFKEKGYRNIWVVPPGPDFGLDIEMTCPNGLRAIVQCKRYGASHPVDRPVVQQTYGVMHLLKAQKCFIVTTGNFTRDALELGRRKDIVLIDCNVLCGEKTASVKKRITDGPKNVSSKTKKSCK